MERRSFIAVAAAAAALGSLGGTALAEGRAEVGGLDKIVQTASDCVAAGRACIRHCQEQFAAGKVKEFEKCLASAQQMTVICEAMGQLAVQRAELAQELLPVCVQACETCRQACAEHEDHFRHGMHQECERCMESCIACRDACKSLS